MATSTSIHTAVRPTASDGPPGDSRVTAYSQRPIAVRFLTRYWAALVVVGISALVAVVQPWVYQAPDYP